MYNFCSQLRTIEYKDKIVLINMLNGKWMRLSKKIYEIIEWCVDDKKSYTELMTALADVEDREYITKIIQNLLKTELLNEGKEILRNSKIVLFEITNRCNLHCIHCCNNAESDSDFELSFEKIIKILEYLVKQQPTSIILSGGEPLIREDFIDIISFLRTKYEGKISLMTNGTLINENNIDSIICNVDEINISVDGIDEDSTKMVRGCGVFEKVISAVKLLKKKNFKDISLSMVMDSNNYHLEKQFFELNNKLETKPLLRGFAEVGRGKENSHFFSGKDLEGYLQSIFSEISLMKENTKKISPCTCTAGKEKILIDYKGNVLPCQWFHEKQYELGNLLCIQNEKFYKNKNINRVEEFYPWNYKQCCDCEVNYFCWPCPGELKEKTENEVAKICRIMKPILFKKVWDEEIVQ